MSLLSCLCQAGIFVTFVAFSFVVSTLAIRRGIPALKRRSEGAARAGESTRREPPQERKPSPPALPDSSPGNPFFDFGAAGFWIGLCETVLIFLFVYLSALGALAIIVAAKEFVRKEQIQEDATYYLLGTLANTTIALLLASVSRAFVRLVC